PPFSPFPNLAATTCRRPCPNSAFPASSRAIGGAYARRVGKKRWRRVKRRAGGCAPPPRGRRATARSPISNASRWIWPEVGPHRYFHNAYASSPCGLDRQPSPLRTKSAQAGLPAAAAKQRRLVGAVGIEPTTSPV